MLQCNIDISRKWTDWIRRICGCISYLKILTPPTTEELRIAFKGLDRNGDGQISFTEIQECLKHAGQPISDEELRGMFDHLDTDKSGAISYEGNFVCNLFQAGTE